METPLLARSPFLLLGWLRNTMRTRPAIDHRINGRRVIVPFNPIVCPPRESNFSTESGAVDR